MVCISSRGRPVSQRNSNDKSSKQRPLGWIRDLIPSGFKQKIKEAVPGIAPPPTDEIEVVEDFSEASTHVVFLPRDPQWAYCFWSISAADRKSAQRAGATQLCIRLADVTGLAGEQTHTQTLQELVVDASSSEWFMPVPLDGRDYRVELGFRLRSGGWYSLAFSAVAHVPGMEPSQRIADAFVPFSLEAGPTAAPSAVAAPSSIGGVQHEQHYQRATLPTRSRRVGSEVLHEYDLNGPGPLNDSGVGVWASGRTESGMGALRERSFWLVADAELIVYGATDPPRACLLVMSRFSSSGTEASASMSPSGMESSSIPFARLRRMVSRSAPSRWSSSAAPPTLGSILRKRPSPSGSRPLGARGGVGQPFAGTCFSTGVGFSRCTPRRC